MSRIITSILDTDFYKFTMGNIVFERFRGKKVSYRFKNRTKGVDLRPHADEIRSEIMSLGDLRVSKKEVEYLRSLGIFSGDYLAFLSGMRLPVEKVSIEVTEDGQLDISVKDAPWESAIFFEIPVLAIVNEVYFKRLVEKTGLSEEEVWAEGEKRLFEKINSIKALRPAAPGSDVPHALESGFHLLNFSTRRRHSKRWGRRVDEILKTELTPSEFAGTSNVLNAMELGLKPQGTMAHEYLQACQAMAPDLARFQEYALILWLAQYGQKLAVALSDVVGFDAFLRSFSPELAAAYLGARHDSGDPFEWGEKLIAHYEAAKIDPKSKVAVFSDGLDFPLAIKLWQRFRGRIRTVFGIGTNLGNDVGFAPLSIVMKMTWCDGKPVAKISDSPGKEMCEDENFVGLLREMFLLKK